MISESVLRRALGRIALLKYFPAGNSEAIAAVAEMFGEVCQSDAQVDHAVTGLLRDVEMSEWPGASVFFAWLRREVWREGMIHTREGWKPHPRNGPKFDIVRPDGSRHWIDGQYNDDPQKPPASSEGSDTH